MHVFGSYLSFLSPFAFSLATLCVQVERACSSLAAIFRFRGLLRFLIMQSWWCLQVSLTPLLKTIYPEGFAPLSEKLDKLIAKTKALPMNTNPVHSASVRLMADYGMGLPSSTTSASARPRSAFAMDGFAEDYYEEGALTARDYVRR